MWIRFFCTILNYSRNVARDMGINRFYICILSNETISCNFVIIRKMIIVARGAWNQSYISIDRINIVDIRHSGNCSLPEVLRFSFKATLLWKRCSFVRNFTHFSFPFSWSDRRIVKRLESARSVISTRLKNLPAADTLF